MDKELSRSLRSMVVFTLVLSLSCGIILNANAQTPTPSSVSDLTKEAEEESLDDESATERSKKFEQIFINKHTQVQEGPAVLPDKIINAAYANRINREMSDQSADYALKTAQDVAQQELTRIQGEKEAEEAAAEAQEESEKQAEEEAQKAAEEAARLAAEQSAQQVAAEEAARKAAEEAAAQQAAAEEAARKAAEEAAAQQAAAAQESSQTTSSASSNSGAHLTAYAGVFNGPSGLETYYNLDMSGVIANMHALGFSGDYWVRDDGVKMFGNYVIVAADLSIRPRGSLVETSLGTGIVCDTGSFIYYNPYQLDIAVAW